MSGWAYSMPVWFHPDLQVIADTPAECAEGMCAVLSELSGQPALREPVGGLTWDQVAEVWAEDREGLALSGQGVRRVAKPGIRVVPA